MGERAVGGHGQWRRFSDARSAAAASSTSTGSDLVRQKQTANLVRGESLYADAYTDEWQWSEPETLFVSGYECAECHAPDGARCRELLAEPKVYVDEPPCGGDEPRS